MDDYIELSYKGQAGGLRRAILGDSGRGSFRGGNRGQGRGFAGGRGGGFRGGRGVSGGGRFRGGRGCVTKKEKRKCARCKERGHHAKMCPYSEQESQKKNAAALQKHADEAVAVASKAAATAAATTSSSATSDTTFPAVFKAPFAGWKPGFIMPAPPTHNNDVNMG
ncbi:rRNA 2'-O-methyltransferase fibrillarin-like isoform X2 [Folsomia candida]|nr:rRNA 2'-O-methyltransferase fibrillarin-like isoform X2 [Folsomia candida]